jgi:hypothetical protein
MNQNNILKFFNYSNSIKISFFIIFLSQICFIHVLTSIYYSYKYLGFIIHLLIILLILFCLRGCFNNEIKNFKKLEFLNNGMKIITFFLIIFYFILLLQLKYSEIDLNMYILFFFSLVTYSIFHLLTLNNLSNFIEKYRDKIIENSSDNLDNEIKESMI